MKFSQKEYDKYDFEAKFRWLKYLDTQGFDSVNIDLKYGIDMVAYKDHAEYRYEVEIKSNYPWTCKNDYPFKTVNFLGRKKKFGHFYYVIMCYETSAFVMCHSSNIYKPSNKKIRNTSRGKDVLYEVSRDTCSFGIIP